MEFSIFLLCFAFFGMSIVTHEVAHGWMAYRCGDPTAKMAGRLTLNPLVHIDPVMTLLLPALTLWTMGFFFGGAKPVPVNPDNLRGGERDNLKVTAVGPASNFAIAAVFALLMHLPIFGERTGTNGAMILMGVTVYTNLLLGVFNLIPVPPLDGSHLLAYFLPPEIRASYRRIGIFGILILIVLIRSVPAFGTALWGSVRILWTLLGLSEDLLTEVMNGFGRIIDSVL